MKSLLKNKQSAKQKVCARGLRDDIRGWEALLGKNKHHLRNPNHNSYQIKILYTHIPTPQNTPLPPVNTCQHVHSLWVRAPTSSSDGQ
ncbi:hypothetical protein Hanom_Chr09g00799021 [Helianthus anomalus]